jgi:hypothetical protein
MHSNSVDFSLTPAWMTGLLDDRRPQRDLRGELGAMRLGRRPVERQQVGLDAASFSATPCPARSRAAALLRTGRWLRRTERRVERETRRRSRDWACRPRPAVGTSGSEVMRWARSAHRRAGRPERIAPDVVVGRSQMASTWPRGTSTAAGRPPLYCTTVSGTPSASWNSMAQRCVALPMPDEAMVNLSLRSLRRPPARRRSAAASSLRVHDQHRRLGIEADELERRQRIEVELLVERRHGRQPMWLSSSV